MKRINVYVDDEKNKKQRRNNKKILSTSHCNFMYDA